MLFHLKPSLSGMKSLPPTQLRHLLRSLHSALPSCDTCPPAFLPPRAPPSWRVWFPPVLDSTPSSWWPKGLSTWPRGKWSVPPGHRVRVCPRSSGREKCSGEGPAGPFQPLNRRIPCSKCCLQFCEDSPGRLILPFQDSRTLRFYKRGRGLLLQDLSGFCHLSKGHIPTSELQTDHLGKAPTCPSL